MSEPTYSECKRHCDMLINKYGQQWMYDPDYYSLVFQRVFNALKTYDKNKSSLKTYLINCFKFAKFHLFYQKSRKKEFQNNISDVYEYFDKYNDIIENQENVESIINKVYTAGKINSTSRNVAMYFFRDLYTVKQIAQKTGLEKVRIDACINTVVRQAKRVFPNKETFFLHK